MTLRASSADLMGNRALTFMFVAALHIGAFYALYFGLLSQFVAHVPGDLSFIPTREIVRTPPTPLPAPDASIKQPAPFVPFPEVPSNEPEPNGQLNETVSVPAVPVPLPSHASRAFTAASYDPSHPFKVGADYYPPAAVRLGQEGRCGVQISIAADGRITSATLATSTGFPLLDEACVAAVRGQHMRPALQDGKAVESQIIVPIVWKLTTRP